MKVVIDLVEAIREEIQDQGDFTLLAMLLKENSEGVMEFVGEKAISRVGIIDDTLKFFVDLKERTVEVGALLRMLNGFENKEMMMEVKVSVNNQSFEVVGFGKSEKDKKFVVFLTM